MSITVKFDNRTKVYFAGQTVSGKAHIVVQEPFHCNRISIKLNGSSTVHWSENSDSKQKYHAEENYYNFKCIVWRPGANGNELAFGNYCYPFTFVLPPFLPSSFEATNGWVRHLLEVRIHTGLFRCDKKCLEPFSVNSNYDLNNEPKAKTPYTRCKEKTLCCLGCRSGPLSFILNIDRTGYVSGEKILINAECTNNSNRVMNYTKAEIVQKVTFMAKGRKKHIMREVCKVVHPSINPGGDDSWAAEPLLIPPLPPTGLLGCNIIDVQYNLKFSMSPSGLALDLSTHMELIIGTIPLYQNFSTFSPSTVSIPQTQNPFPSAFYISPQQPYLPQQINVQPTAPSMLMPSRDLPPTYNEAIQHPYAFPALQQYPELPPPTYSECVFGRVTVGHLKNGGDGSGSDSENEDDDSGGGGMPWSPLYVSYNAAHNYDRQQHHTIEPPVGFTSGDFT